MFLKCKQPEDVFLSIFSLFATFFYLSKYCSKDIPDTKYFYLISPHYTSQYKLPTHNHKFYKSN